MKRRVVSFHYTLRNQDGRVIDSSARRNPVSYLEGAGNIVPGLEAELNRLQAGEKRSLMVPSASGYGPRDERLVIRLSRDKLPQGARVGDRFRGGDDPQSPVFTVTAISETEAVFDANHPMAGQDLYFEVEVTGIRDATWEEIKRGRARCSCSDHKEPPSPAVAR